MVDNVKKKEHFTLNNNNWGKKKKSTHKKLENKKKSRNSIDQHFYTNLIIVGNKIKKLIYFEYFKV